MLETKCGVVKSLITMWRESIRPRVNQALELTPEDKLDWAPVEKMISLGNIFLHFAETSDWWYDEVMKGCNSVELAVGSCSPKSEIVKHLNAHWERMERFFAEPPDVLEKTYEVKRKDKTYTFTGNWIFVHLFEHDIHHRSQINQYLRILGITPPGGK
jgi:uncharacterized damage-inducible protein DinB